jgi:hypothetical protein
LRQKVNSNMDNEHKAIVDDLLSGKRLFLMECEQGHKNIQFGKDGRIYSLDKAKPIIKEIMELGIIKKNKDLKKLIYD